MVAEKIRWRCIVDHWGYCKDNEGWEIKPVLTTTKQGGIVMLSDGKCNEHPSTCRKYQSQVERVQADKKRRVKHAKQNRANGTKSPGH